MVAGSAPGGRVRLLKPPLVVRVRFVDRKLSDQGANGGWVCTAETTSHHPPALLGVGSGVVCASGSGEGGVAKDNGGRIGGRSITGGGSMDVRSVVVEERTAVNSIPILSSESVSVIESIVLRRWGRLVDRA